MNLTKKHSLFALIVLIAAADLTWRLTTPTYRGKKVAEAPFGISNLKAVINEIQNRVRPHMTSVEIRNALTNAGFECEDFTWTECSGIACRYIKNLPPIWPLNWIKYPSAEEWTVFVVVDPNTSQTKISNIEYDRDDWMTRPGVAHRKCK